MPISSVNRVKTIAVPLTANTGNTLTTIYESPSLQLGSELIAGYKVVSCNSFIKNLKAYTRIESLNEAPLPDFSLEDSDTAKTQKILDIEWKSPRKQLNLFINSGSDWYPVGATSVLNPMGYLFRIYNLMDLFTDNLALELGDNSKIGIQVQDVGYGLLVDDDTITIHGSYVEEFFVESTEITNFHIYLNNVSVGGNNTDNTQPEDDEMANWIIVTDTYQAKAKDKIVAVTSDKRYPIVLPPSPQVGDCIKVSLISPNNWVVDIDTNGKLLNGQQPAVFCIPNDLIGIELIYVSGIIGWTYVDYQSPSIVNPSDEPQSA